MQKKRHHFVPKAYLNAFCNQDGQVFVYRKDDAPRALTLAPDATQFRGYYYSQPTPEGGRDNNTLEDLFSTVESGWQDTVARLQRREDVNDRLENIFEFIALQRVRVPAARDAVEAMLAQTVKSTMKVMQANGSLPPVPAGLTDIDAQIQIAIDPHQSIHAMATMMTGMATLFSQLGLSATHNPTGLPFLTSDNPVLWFDPSVPFSEQRPYTIHPDGGPVFLFFPVSPTLAIVGSPEYKEVFGQHGLLHSEVPSQAWVEQMNAQVCRFAYEAVIASDGSQADLIAEFAKISPVLEMESIQVGTGVANISRMGFGPRTPKPKW